MIINRITPKRGKNEFDVLIEIPMNSPPVKYEFDKEICTLRVDRIMNTAMFYPANYGFIPQTLSDDGDPVDVLVLSSYPINSGAVVTVRAIAVLFMEDESGIDEKIIAVPINKIDSMYQNVSDLSDINETIQNKITHFFEYYKLLDKGKWAKIQGWGNKSSAIKIIENGISKYQR